MKMKDKHVIIIGGGFNKLNNEPLAYIYQLLVGSGTIYEIERQV